MPFDPSRPLQGQKALVTGAASGIGAAIARRFAQAGAAVGINYRSDPGPAEEMAQEIRREGGEALPVKADVSKETDVRDMVAEFLEAFGRIDIVVPNAGIQKDAPFADMTLEQWEAVIGVNLTGQFLTAREAVRHFLKQGADPNVSRATGKIIVVSSVHQLIPWAGHVNYAASKGGSMLMMKSLAQEVADKGIRVNGIAPGAIKTNINRQAWETPDAEQKLLKLVPYGRVGEPDDVAEAAIWLASDASDYVTGTTLFIDGGMSLFPGFREGG
uniref:Glucose 1-dehydrogenase n=1 Tax=Pseudomonas sp. K-62 TaxID=76885 RepID=I2FG36_9PSED|nr:glucose 1-dehydrogenase [Pseudomonas sp. K-62]BAM13971.1 glucose 1-dehydrogenase [Pseudomonas sp. K-62]